jgi:hypothetical protein
MTGAIIININYLYSPTTLQFLKLVKLTGMMANTHMVN